MVRTPEQLREHYEVEKELAQRLKTAPAAERKYLYPVVYQELYRRVPHHPRNQRKYDPAKTVAQVSEKMSFLRRFLKAETTYLEIGAGDCSLTMQVAKLVKKAYAFDVAYQLREGVEQPSNFELIIMPDGCQIPLGDGVVDLAYSNQLMEHIHPDDAVEQLQHIFRVLRPGGQYICITPNKAAGPQDVSRHFDETATCFHLMEYRMKQLAEVLERAGFRDLKAYSGIRGNHLGVPMGAVDMLEGLMLSLPYRMRWPLANGPVIGSLLSLTLVGQKPL